MSLLRSFPAMGAIGILMGNEKIQRKEKPVGFGVRLVLIYAPPCCLLYFDVSNQDHIIYS